MNDDFDSSTRELKQAKLGIKLAIGDIIIEVNGSNVQGDTIENIVFKLNALNRNNSVVVQRSSSKESADSMNRSMVLRRAHQNAAPDIASEGCGSRYTHEIDVADLMSYLKDADRMQNERRKSSKYLFVMTDNRKQFTEWTELKVDSSGRKDEEEASAIITTKDLPLAIDRTNSRSFNILCVAYRWMQSEDDFRDLQMDSGKSGGGPTEGAPDAGKGEDIDFGDDMIGKSADFVEEYSNSAKNYRNFFQWPRTRDLAKDKGIVLLGKELQRRFLEVEQHLELVRESIEGSVDEIHKKNLKCLQEDRIGIIKEAMHSFVRRPWSDAHGSLERLGESTCKNLAT